MVTKAFRFRIYPNAIQRDLLARSFGCRGRRAYGLTKRLWRKWPLPSLPKVSQFNEARIPFLKEGECQYLPTERFAFFKDRAPALDVTCLDDPIRELVQALNQLPGIATVWSCSGHIHQDVDDEPGYRCVVVEEGNSETWELLVDAWLPHGKVFEIGTLESHPNEESSEAYVSWIFRWWNRAEEAGAGFLQQLLWDVEDVMP